MAKALFINPPIYDFALFDLFLKPYGLLRVESLFVENGYETEFINCLDYKDLQTASKLSSPKRKSNGTGKFFRDDIENSIFADSPSILFAQTQAERKLHRYGILASEISRRIKEFSPDIILITTGMTYWYLGVKETISIIREILPGVPIVCGGIYASLMADHCKDVCGADFVVQSNQVDQINPLLDKLTLPKLKGPVPEFPLFRPEIFDAAGILRLNQGCPNRCDYCASSLISPRFEKGNHEESFRFFSKMYEAGIRNFAFYDDAILVDARNIFVPFLKKVISNYPDVNFYTPNAMHIKLLTEEIVSLMAAAGFREVRLGFESYDEDFHEKYDHKFKFVDFVSSIDLLNKYGFCGSALRLYTLAGLPGQRAEEVASTLEKVRGLDARISIAEYSPVPRTALWEKSLEISKFPLASEPLFHNNSFLPLQWEGFTLSDLAELKRISHRPFIG
ncbi:MAG: cobalamin-dependent protein [Spirochaetales bacterium]|nr:cobalamin-dependent protein [Spirochaetales bacterium]